MTANRKPASLPSILTPNGKVNVRYFFLTLDSLLEDADRYAKRGDAYVVNFDLLFEYPEMIALYCALFDSSVDPFVYPYFGDTRIVKTDIRAFARGVGTRVYYWKTYDYQGNVFINLDRPRSTLPFSIVLESRVRRGDP